MWGSNRTEVGLEPTRKTVWITEPEKGSLVAGGKIPHSGDLAKCKRELLDYKQRGTRSWVKNTAWAREKTSGSWGEAHWGGKKRPSGGNMVGPIGVNAGRVIGNLA